VSVAAVIVAAGRGVRFGGDQKKQFLAIGGRSVLEWTLAAFQSSAVIEEIVVVVGREDLEFVEEFSQQYSKVSNVVPGGETRQESCWNGLSRLGENIEYVAVHDGARPCVTTEIIEKTVDVAKVYRAAVTGTPVPDTMVRAEDDDKGPVLGKVLDRRTMWRIQTPQVFELALLRDAALKARKDEFVGTDESSLVKRFGVPVRLVRGRFDNIKLTNPEDLALAKAILLQRESE
jgi:2-C-methyl-D-erythritol 4-phosphate cytidylyltransferase